MFLAHTDLTGFPPFFMMKKHIVFSRYHLIHHVWVNKVWVITQPHMGQDFVSFPMIKPLVAVYQMLPQTVFLPGIRWIQQNPFSETVWVAPSCLPPCTRWEPPRTQITEVSWKKSCLQAFYGKQQGAPCCTPPCCFLLYFKCSVLRDKMKSARL